MKQKRIVVRPSLSINEMKIIYRLLKEEDLKIEKRNKPKKKESSCRTFQTTEELMTYFLTNYFSVLIIKAKKGK